MRIHHATLAKAKKFAITLTIEDNEVVATAKDGTRLASGLQGNKVLEEAITKLTGKPAKKGTDSAAKKERAKARKAAPRDEESEDEEETGEESEALAEEGDAEADESDAEQGDGVVKDKYKKLYKEHGGTCGDDLAKQLSEHVAGKDGNVDKAKLKRFAEANGAWKPAYASLKTKFGAWNGGLARMNVSNILRGKMRRAAKAGEKFEIEWA